MTFKLQLFASLYFGSGWTEFYWAFIIAVVLHLGWTNIAGPLFVNLHFYIFIQQGFRAGATNSSPAQALLVGCYIFRPEATKDCL